MPGPLLAALLPLLAALALVPAQVLAGPPEQPSGRMVLQRDLVADGLRKCRREKDRYKRLQMLSNLARTQDPRVAIELGWRVDLSDAEARLALFLLDRHFAQPQAFGGQQDREYTMKDIRFLLMLPDDQEYARDWWQKNKADLRRRAARLSR